MPEMNPEKAQGQPKKDEVITLSLDNLEEDLNNVFGELGDDAGIEFKDQKKDIKPESPENVFLANNPDARKVIEETSDTEVDFDGVNDKVANEVTAIVRKKIDANQIFLGLSGDVLVEAEGAKNKIFSERNLSVISEDDVEAVAEELFAKIEAAVAEIEMKHAPTQ